MTIKKNEGHTMPKNMRFASAEHFDALWSWNTLERRPDIAHLTFTQKSKCGGKSLSVLLQSSKHPKEYPCFKKVSDLAYSKKREKKEERKK